MFWSRRRILGAAATMTVAASSSLVLNPSTAWAATPSPAADDGDPFGLPDTDRAKAVRAWLLGGRAVRASAATALAGTDADVRNFLAVRLPADTATDNRAAIVSSLAVAGRGNRREATAALGGGDSAIAGYLAGGYKPALMEDLRVATTTVMAVGGKAVNREGNTALNNGSQSALESFLGDREYTARVEDMRVDASKLSFQAGPEVQKYASRALSGSDKDLEWFLETGQHIARARDQEAMKIQELVALVQREGKRADAMTKQAEEACARAVTAAAQAREMAERAAAEARAAQEDVARAAGAARKAAEAASGAARASRVAITASQAAVQAARRAGYAAAATSAAAANAGAAATRAFNAALDVSRDASQAQKAREAAVAARTAAAQARSAAAAAESAAAASDQARIAGDSAAAAARDSAAAARASSDAADASGAAQHEAANARREAQIASANAQIATNAAGNAVRLANASAQAARTARDAANGAAGHAEKAAAAAAWAVQYAGQAVDYANKSTEFANEASKAADLATDAVVQAVAVEKAARDAEGQRLEQDLRQAVEEMRLLARLDAEQRAQYTGKRTEAEQTTQAAKDLIARAGAALRAGDTALATTTGRQAAVAVMDARGTWSRQAARFALAGTEADIHIWIDADRLIAERLDDRERALYLARRSSPDVIDAAGRALASTDPDATATFLGTGVVQASAMDNRVAISRILAGRPGRAVAKAANEALDAGSAQALYGFFSASFEAAQREDDAVATATLLGTAGPYTKAHAQAALEGPAWIRRNFIASVQHRTAELDHDSATHIAAMQGAISAAAKIAHKAQEDAARAQEAAARARNAAAEAVTWADKALNWAAQAASAARQADSYADSAEKSAQDARVSAGKATQAAATARTAMRSANYSANRAVESARSAVASANAAQASAASAYETSLQADGDRVAAAEAASAAQTIEKDKRRAEIGEEVRKALEEALKARAEGKNPADSPENDSVGGDIPQWQQDARTLANILEWASLATSVAGTSLEIAGVWFPPAEVAGLFLSVTSVGLSQLSALFTGIGYGFTSSEFQHAIGNSMLHLVTFGQSQWIKKLDGGKVVTAIEIGLHGSLSVISSGLHLFG
ncbi:hypothetical protein ACODT3_01545 [Streptomyces sp. 4.24]|uniref:ALF repeat-containing protein n=1 Tax=Streptomyces tritrimontium TaxID=3406573 RepID=UPI003BB7DC84